MSEIEGTPFSEVLENAELVREMIKQFGVPGGVWAAAVIENVKMWEKSEAKLRAALAGPFDPVRDDAPGH